MKSSRLLYLVVNLWCGIPRNARKTLWLLCSTISFLAWTLSFANAQAANEAGVKPFLSFHGGSFDQINLVSQKLDLRLPLLSYPQRGKLGLDYVVRWHNALWNQTRLCPPNNQCTFFWQYDRPPGVSVVAEQAPPRIDQVLLGNGNTTNPYYGYAIMMPDESQHPLGNTTGTQYESLDTTALHWDKSTNIVTLADGTRYVPQSDGVTTLMQDTNGNQISFGSTVVDTMGRNLSQGGATSDFNNCTGLLPIASASLWQVPGPNGGTATYKFCFAKVHIFTNHTFPNCTTNQCVQVNADLLMLQSIVLPDGQSAWTFDYSQPDANGVNWGDLVKITFPFGGSISYTWGTATGCRVLHGPSGSTYRGAGQRTIDANNGAGGQTWSYSAGTVTDPLGNATVHTFTNLNNSCSPYETKTQYYSGSQSNGKLLKTVATQYSYGLDPNVPAGTTPLPADNVVPTSVTTTLPNGLVKQTLYTYDLGFQFTSPGQTGTYAGIYGKVTTQQETDWGQGTAGGVLRETDTSYQFQNDISYLNANMISLVTSVIVKDGVGSQAAKTTFGYDETFNNTSVQPSGITTQLGSPPNAIRGNQTSVSKWLLSSGTALTSHTIPFDTGEPYQLIDPLLNTTTYSFDPVYAGVYQTMTCNALNHCVSGTYDFNTGLLASFTGENATQQASGNTPGDVGHTTSYQYDVMSRLTSVTSPPDASGNQPYTQYIYSAPNTFPFSTEKLEKIVGNTQDDSTSYLDGLGRPYQTVHTSAGKATVVTTYDSAGRVASVTNPYFSTNDSTYGVVSYQYDALARTTQTTKQDGSVSAVAYDQASGSKNCSLITDEAGNQRQTCSDGLGRMVEVDEPQASSAGVRATASVTVSGSLAVAQNATFVNAQANSPIVMASPGDFYYLDNNGHVREVTLISNEQWAAWNNADITATAGAPVAIAGSQMAAYRDASGRTYILYVASNQHVEAVYYSGSCNCWSALDVGSINGTYVAASGTPIVMKSAGDFYYLDSNEHVRQITLLANGSWASWTNADITSYAGAPAAVAGSQMAGYYDSSGRTYILYVASNQHVEAVYYSGSCNCWSALDVGSINGPVLAASGTPIVMKSAGDFYYLDSNEHVRQITLLSDGTWARWTNADINANAGGAPPAAAGSQMAGYYDSSGRSYILYVASNQHVEAVYYSGTCNCWSALDVGSINGTYVAASNTPIVMAGAGDFYYICNGGHICEVPIQANGTFPNWTNYSPTYNTPGAPLPIGGSQIAAYRTSGGNTYLLYVNSTPHLQALWYNNGWNYIDLGVSGTSAYDSGTVSIALGGFSAAACYGKSTAPACSGQPVNSATSEIASTLANAINVASSPATASVSGSTINLTWNTPGSFTPAVSALSTTHDNPNVFPNPSFTSPPTSFANGAGNLGSNPYVTLYGYDVLGNLLRVDQKGAAPSDSTQWRTRQFSYDSLSRLLTASNPESGTIGYSYDSDGNLLQKTAPAPNQTGSATQTISYCYDSLNRITGKAYSAQTCTKRQLPSGTAAVIYGYDSGTNGIGHLTSLSDQPGSASYSYDALGRLISEQRTTATISKSMSFGYNLDGSLASIKYPSGAVVTYTPDAAGRAITAVDSGNNINYVTGATYGPDSSLTGFINGKSATFGGIFSTFAYNKRLQPCRIAVSNSAAVPLDCLMGWGNVLDLGYDFHLGNGDNGNVWGITRWGDQTRNQTFTYDALNRLSAAQNAGTDCTQKTGNGFTKFWGNSYGYDAWGNLIQKAVTKCSAENLNVTALGNNQLSGYGYDAAGNMTHDATTGNNYGYDAENRLTGAGGYAYSYDASGNRVKKSNGSTGTLYWYSPEGLLTETDLSGNVQHEYIFFGGNRVARKDSGGVHYYFSNQIHSAAVIADSSGNITEDEDYFPWGGELQITNNDSNDYKFTGKKRDTESGLDYFEARYYGNWFGRFLTPDWAAKPITVPYADFGDPQSLNLYSYVRNSPIARFDVDGHFISGGATPAGQGPCGQGTNSKCDDLPPLPPEEGIQKDQNGNILVVRTDTKIVGYTDNDPENGLPIFQTTQVTATFSTQKGHEGQFLDATSQTVTSVGEVPRLPADRSSGEPAMAGAVLTGLHHIGFAEATADLGTKLRDEGIAAATPGIAHFMWESLKEVGREMKITLNPKCQIFECH